MINVLLVDDHELVRTGIEALLNAAEDIKVAGVAKTGEEAVEAMAALSADVVLMDVNTPGIGSQEACRRILYDNPEAKIIVVSVNKDGPIPQQLLKLGVAGFISKKSPVEELLYTIRKVKTDENCLSRLKTNYPIAKNSDIDRKSPFSKLSPRESEVVTLILEGKSIKEMSEMLILSDKTVNTYRYRLYDKLNIKNDVELTRLAIKLGHIDEALI